MKVNNYVEGLLWSELFPYFMVRTVSLFYGQNCFLILWSELFPYFMVRTVSLFYGQNCLWSELFVRTISLFSHFSSYFQKSLALQQDFIYWTVIYNSHLFKGAETKWKETPADERHTDGEVSRLKYSQVIYSDAVRW